MTKTGTGSARKWQRRQLREGIAQDEAEIRRYSRLLKLNKRRKSQARLPKVFKDTGLDYLLDIVGGDSDKDDGDDNDLRDKNPFDEARVAEIVRECPESAEYYSQLRAASEAAKTKQQMKKTKKAKRRRISSVGAEAEEDSVEQKEEEQVAEPAPKKPDLYGRDLATSGVKPSTSAEQLVDSVESEELLNQLRRRMRGLVNRVSERVLARVSAELESVYLSSPRAPATRTLSELLLDVAANSGEPMSDRMLVDQASLVAIVCANVTGCELGAHLAEALAMRLGTDAESLSRGLETGGKASHNLLLLAMFLCWLGVISGRLPFDLLQLLADLATEPALDALVLCLRHAGLQLRRLDGARMRGLLDGLQQRAERDGLAEQLGGEASRGRFLLELLQAVRNNNYRKIPGYDCEYVERARKAVRQLARSEATPVEFGLADVREASTKGRWWLVGAAYTPQAPDLPAPSVQTAAAATPSAIGNQSQQRHLDSMAARLGLKTPQRRAIFAALVGAADADDAAARLLRLMSTAAGATAAADVASIALKCATRESASYNPFYAAALLRVRRGSRRFAMPLRCAIWDQLGALGDTRQDRAARLGDLIADLLLAGALPPAAVMSRFPFELVPGAGSKPGSKTGTALGGSSAAVCLISFAAALKRRAADSPELPALLTGLAGDAEVARCLAAGLVVAGRQLNCPEADWLLQRLRSLAS